MKKIRTKRQKKRDARKSARMSKRADKLGLTMDELKQRRAQRKQAISGIAQDLIGVPVWAKSKVKRAAAQEDRQTAAFDTQEEAIKNKVDTVKPMGFGSSSGDDSPTDRKDIGSNASAMWRKKKGYNW